MSGFEKCKYADSCVYDICVPEFCNEYEVAHMTNGDRIRAMTDEELAAVVPCPSDGNCDNKDKWNCKECCLRWLQQPVKGDAE